MIFKARDTIFDEYNHIECIIIHSTDENNLPTLWRDDLLISIITQKLPGPSIEWTNNDELLMQPNIEPKHLEDKEQEGSQSKEEEIEEEVGVEEELTVHVPKDFETAPGSTLQIRCTGGGNDYMLLMLNFQL